MDIKKGQYEIGIIQPVYNIGEFVKSSIESICRQSFTNFIYVIIDDGSLDNTIEIIESFNDDRIMLVRGKHRGLVNTLNIGVDLLKNKCRYIARMDGDDISKIDRIEKQFNFMEKNKNIKICSTWAERYDKFGVLFEKFAPNFQSPFDLKVAMLKMNFIIHGSVMFSGEIFDEIIRYEDCFIEDYDLWMKILNKFDGMVIPEYLYELHSREGSLTNLYANQIYNEAKICREYWSGMWETGIPENDYIYMEDL